MASMDSAALPRGDELPLLQHLGAAVSEATEEPEKKKKRKAKRSTKPYEVQVLLEQSDEEAREDVASECIARLLQGSLAEVEEENVEQQHVRRRKKRKDKKPARLVTLQGGSREEQDEEDVEEEEREDLASGLIAGLLQGSLHALEEQEEEVAHECAARRRRKKRRKNTKTLTVEILGEPEDEEDREGVASEFVAGIFGRTLLALEEEDCTRRPRVTRSMRKQRRARQERKNKRRAKKALRQKYQHLMERKAFERLPRLAQLQVFDKRLAITVRLECVVRPQEECLRAWAWVLQRAGVQLQDPVVQFTEEEEDTLLSLVFFYFLLTVFIDTVGSKCREQALAGAASVGKTPIAARRERELRRAGVSWGVTAREPRVSTNAPPRTTRPLSRRQAWSRAVPRRPVTWRRGSLLGPQRTSVLASTCRWFMRPCRPLAPCRRRPGSLPSLRLGLRPAQTLACAREVREAEGASQALAQQGRKWCPTRGTQRRSSTRRCPTSAPSPGELCAVTSRGASRASGTSQRRRREMVHAPSTRPSAFQRGPRRGCTSRACAPCCWRTFRRASRRSTRCMGAASRRPSPTSWTPCGWSWRCRRRGP